MPPAGSSRASGAATAPDRRQSARQGRTSVTRPTNYYARSFAGRMAALGGMEQTPPAANPSPGFVPALTHFTQAVDAFPKELIKHFSMFKEVEAKIHDPEREMKRLLDTIAQLPVPTLGQRRAAEESQSGGNESAANSVSGLMMTDVSMLHQQLSETLFPPPETFNNLSADEQADLQKRRYFFQLRNVIHSMLPALDEKLVVLASANGTKDKGLARMDHSYSQLDDEISSEARYGSLTHWAYADKEEKKKGGTERSRREVASANNLAAAAQHVHDADSIAAKSEARREAIQANKRSRHQHADSDFDDRPVKKAQKRKAAAAEPAAAGGIGLGIVSTGAAPQGKRKKTEKALAAAAAAPAMERSLSGAVQAAATGLRGGASPRATPAPESTSKRKPRAAPAPAQRKRALPTNSPPVAPSPLASTFAITKATGATERPTSSRARKNSSANSVTSTPQDTPAGPRPSTSHSVQQGPSNNSAAEPEQPGAAPVQDTNAKGDSTPQEPPEPPAPTVENSDLKREEVDTQETEAMDVDPPAPTPASAARSGRTSKTATPVVGAFPEVPMARSRSTRNNNGNGNSQPSSENNSTTTGVVSKRGHKKNSVSSASVAVPAPAVKAAKENVASGPPSTASSLAPEPEYSDGGDEGDDEPRYCYCNEVSYGSMIACDNENCEREWFHLACVNMDKAPNARTKWYCSDGCKEAAMNARAKANGKGGTRPGNSRQ